MTTSKLAETLTEPETPMTLTVDHFEREVPVRVTRLSNRLVGVHVRVGVSNDTSGVSFLGDRTFRPSLDSKPVFP